MFRTALDWEISTFMKLLSIFACFSIFMVLLMVQNDLKVS